MRKYISAYFIERSGSYNIKKKMKLLDYQPKYTNVETIKLTAQKWRIYKYDKACSLF